MGKAEETRKKIIINAATLFNTQGYNGTAISDVMRATGLKKGGIYSHFASKDELALAAFDYAYEKIREQYRDIFKRYPDDHMKQLIAIIEVYRDMDKASPVDGGCPLLNTAIESDDYHPELKGHAQTMMRQWERVIKRVVKAGIDAGAMREDVDVDGLTTLIISSLEGAVMMSKLMDKSDYLNQTVDFLIQNIEVNVCI